eukprot:TRINITY_DN11564_c0_g1_i1.p1 TRINITY_DN11564_c0_g1~~TRINITY_DN11564_c0_g1_i1.p1  ORF type:complete len:793 (-),score=90.98 TRINITY_DN11564_c0_g1_i1:351-2729(-)
MDTFESKEGRIKIDLARPYIYESFINFPEQNWDFTIYTQGYWCTMLNNHDLHTIICEYFLPPEFVLYRKPMRARRMLDCLQNWKLEHMRLKYSMYGYTSSQFTYSKKLWKQKKVRRSKKSLVHGLRSLHMGIVYLETGKIDVYNQERVNAFYHKIIQQKLESWEDLRSDYMPIYEKLRLHFKNLATHTVQTEMNPFNVITDHPLQNTAPPSALVAFLTSFQKFDWKANDLRNQSLDVCEIQKWMSINNFSLQGNCKEGDEENVAVAFCSDSACAPPVSALVHESNGLVLNFNCKAKAISVLCFPFPKFFHWNLQEKIFIFQTKTFQAFVTHLRDKRTPEAICQNLKLYRKIWGISANLFFNNLDQKWYITSTKNNALSRELFGALQKQLVDVNWKEQAWQRCVAVVFWKYMLQKYGNETDQMRKEFLTKLDKSSCYGLRLVVHKSQILSTSKRTTTSELLGSLPIFFPNQECALEPEYEFECKKVVVVGGRDLKSMRERRLVDIAAEGVWDDNAILQEVEADLKLQILAKLLEESQFHRKMRRIPLKDQIYPDEVNPPEELSGFAKQCEDFFDEFAAVGTELWDLHLCDAQGFIFCIDNSNLPMQNFLRIVVSHPVADLIGNMHYFSHRHHLEKHFLAVVRNSLWEHQHDKAHNIVTMFPQWKDWYEFVYLRFMSFAHDCDTLYDTRLSKLSDKDFAKFITQQKRSKSPGNYKLRVPMLCVVRKLKLGRKQPDPITNRKEYLPPNTFLAYLMSGESVRTPSGCRLLERCLFSTDAARFPIQVTRRRFTTHRI